MRVAIFTDTYLPQINGVTNTLSKLVAYFESVGVEYKIFMPRYKDKTEGGSIEDFFSMRMILYPENRLAFPNSFRVAAILRDFKPDMIHIMTEFNMGLAGLNYGKKHGIPTVSNYTTNFSQYSGYYNLDFLKKHIWNYLKWFHSQNEFTLCPSYAAQRELNQNGIHNTRIFSRGIDCVTFHPEARDNQLREQMGIADKLTFLYVGRVSFEKDLDILCESYHRLRQTYKDRVALVITGDGPYLEKCRLTFPEDTIFTGYLRGKELARIYASCDIFTCPSSTETFGNVIQEAMASGLPVIGADAGGVGEIIQHGVNGMKFAKRNSEELTSLMAQLVEEDILRNHLRSNAREYALKRSWNQIFDGLMDTYLEVLGNREKYLSDQQVKAV